MFNSSSIVYSNSTPLPTKNNIYKGCLEEISVSDKPILKPNVDLHISISIYILTQ